MRGDLDSVADDALGGVTPSPLDGRVWCAWVPGADTWTGMHASTSVRRVKEYVARTAGYHADLEPDDMVWVRTESGWDLYAREDAPEGAPATRVR